MLSVFIVCLMLVMANGLADPPSSPATTWWRAGINTNRLAWGRPGALIWSLPPPSGPALDGPRGLIRLHYPVLTNGGYDLINFIAVEPVVAGQKGFSELERSRLDGLDGKRLRADGADANEQDAQQAHRLPAGTLTRLDGGAERLTLTVRVERFQNGAHVRLIVSQRSDAPDEINFVIQAEPDSAPIEYCILTATMGNKARARHLWLRDERVSSLELYPDYREPDFAPHKFFPLERLLQNAPGGVCVAVTTDEANPAAAPPPPGASHWYYGGFPVTQYWRKLPGTWRADLHVAVNGRFTYWLSRYPIPGGLAFENFELRERFYDGQSFTFGITRRPPAELGFPTPRARERTSR